MSWADEFAVKRLPIPRPTRTEPLTERLAQERFHTNAIGFTADIETQEDEGE